MARKRAAGRKKKSLNLGTKVVDFIGTHPKKIFGGITAATLLGLGISDIVFHSSIARKEEAEKRRKESDKSWNEMKSRW